ncbi:unnamed protein product [Symbiodinium natans]|uniref:Uncharacterized protein n=1 Tax=Symbiodinium natans TaxID=878477 RepID=A0A812PWQ4_9DINO|nr:unnamed protein product [Symbiodinium natans]
MALLRVSSQLVIFVAWWLATHRGAACRFKPSARMPTLPATNDSLAEPLPDAAFVLDDGDGVDLKQESARLDVIDHLVLRWVRWMDSMSQTKLGQMAVLLAAFILPVVFAMLPVLLMYMFLEKGMLMDEARGPRRRASGHRNRHVTYSVTEEGVHPILVFATYVADFATPSTGAFRRRFWRILFRTDPWKLHCL